jgi:hypothetical protein
MNILKKLLFSLVLFLNLFISIQPLNLLDIKDTLSILKEDFYRCSPAIGAIWWESGLVKRYYDFGDAENEWDVDNFEGDGTVRLVKCLFNVVQGSFSVSTNNSYPAIHINAGLVGKIIAKLEAGSVDDLEALIKNDEDFKRSISSVEVSQNSFKKDKEGIEEQKKEKQGELDSLKNEILKSLSISKKNLNINFLRNLVSNIEKWIINFDTLVAELANIEEQLNTNNAENENIKEIEEQKKEKQDELDSLKNEISESLSIPKKKLNISFLRDLGLKRADIVSNDWIERFENLEKKVNELKVALAVIKKQLNINNAEKAKDRVRALVDAIVGSYRECGYENENSDLKYPLYATHAILLSFLYRKTENKKQLKNYFVELNRNRNIFRNENEELDSEWEDRTYLGDDFNVLKDHLESVASTNLLMNLDDLDDLDDLEKAIYVIGIQQLYRQSAPKLDQYRAPSFNGVKFPDCMETTIRNICNIALYDANNYVFKLQDANYSDNFRGFYEKHKNAQILGDSEVHQDWVRVVANRPFIAYNRVLYNTNYSQLPVGYGGFMVAEKDDIPEDLLSGDIDIRIGQYSHRFDVFKIGGIKYILIDGSEYKGFELMPTLRNLIVLLIDFFGVSFEKDAFWNSEDFNSSAFGSLLSELKFELDQQITNKKLNSDVFGERLDISLRYSENIFSLALSTGHGEINFIKTQKTENGLEDLSKFLIETLIGENLSQKNKALVLLSLFKLGIDNFNWDLDSIKELKYRLFFLLPLGDSFVKMGLLRRFLPETINEDDKKMFSKLIIKLPIQEDIVYHREVFNLLKDNNLLSDDIFIKALSDVVDKIKEIRSTLVIDFFEGLVNENLFFDVAAKVASNAVQSENNSVRHAGFRLFESLFLKDQGFDAAVEAASNAVQSEDYSVSYEGLQLFESLVKKGQGFDAAVKAASQAVQSGDNSVRYNGFGLFGSLVRNGQGFDAAVKAASNAVQSEDYRIREEGFGLFESLVKKGQGFDAAVEAASNAVQSENNSVRHAGFRLFESLVLKDQGFDVAAKVASNAVQSENNSVSCEGLRLFESLVKKGQGFDAAVEVASNAVQSEDYRIREEGFGLFGSLVRNGQGFDAAVEAASNAVQSEDYKIREEGFGLFGSLVKKGQGFDVAVEAASNAVQSEDYRIRKEGFGFFGSLVRNGQGFDAAVEAASNAVQSENYSVSYEGFQLFGSLVRNGQGFDAAVEAASNVVQSEDYSVSYEGFQLFESLVKKGQGFDAAVEAASNAVQSENNSVRHAGFQLFESLFLKDQGFDAAVEAASNAVQSKDYRIREEGLGLFGSLVRNGQGFDAAVEAASNAVQSEDYSVSCKGFQLFELLFLNNQGFDAVSEVASNAVQSENNSVRHAGFRLFESLFLKDQGFDAAVKAASNAVQSEDYSVSYEGVNLFRLLFEKNQGFDAAVEVASQAVQSGDDSLRHAGLELFESLVRKDQGFDAAVEAASQAVQSGDDSLRRAGLELFESLVRKDQGFDAAVEAASQAVQSGDDRIREEGVNLFRLLFEKNQGFDAAVEAASQAVQSGDDSLRRAGLELFESLVRKNTEGAIDLTRSLLIKKDKMRIGLDLYALLLQELDSDGIKNFKDSIKKELADKDWKDLLRQMRRIGRSHRSNLFRR